MRGTFALPPLDGDAPPAFTSATTCREWIIGLHLANPVHVQSQLAEQIGLLNRYALGAAERLRVLELLREPVAFVQAETAKRFTARPLPLGPQELTAFEANIALWQAMCAGYHHCLESALDGDTDVLADVVRIVQRALWALNGEQLDLCRASYDLGPGYWRRLHGTFAVGEQLGAAGQPVGDMLIASRGTTVHAAYVFGLLLHAVSPYELSARQFNLVQRWLLRWSNKIKLCTSAPQNHKLPPLIVDVAGDRPGSQNADDAGNLRWLDLDGLAHSIKKRIAALHKGAAPTSLGLGEDCSQPDCELLLRHIYEHCCKGSVARAQTRRPGSGGCKLVAGFDAIYYFLAGKLFEQPQSGDEFSKRQRDEIALFGQRAKRFEETFARDHGFRMESWNMLDESPSGMRLFRPLAEEGARIALGQLLAVLPPGSSGLRLGMVRWRTATEDQLRIGVRLLAGVPKPVTVCATGLTSVVGPRCRPGFLLPAVEALNQPPSVVFPVSAFRADRVVEIMSDQIEQARIARIVERGQDFERAEYRKP
jgi:cyclic-di-GMP-binding protein